MSLFQILYNLLTTLPLSQIAKLPRGHGTDVMGDRLMLVKMLDTRTKM